MLVIFGQIAVFFVFIIIGFLLGKTVLKSPESASVLSTLLVYVFLPCNIIKTFASQFSFGHLAANYTHILISAAILAVIMAGAWFSARLFSKNGYERKIFEYTLVIPNFGYMGYAIMGSLYGDAALLNMMVFAIPVMLYTYTRGFAMLTNSRVGIKSFCNPIILSVVVGMIIGLTGLRLPGVISDLIDMSSACMGPVSMLLTGITISAFCLKTLFTDVRIYIVTALRLVVIPGCIFLVLKLLGLDAVILPAVLLYAMPCGLNTIVFPKLVGENCQIGASAAVISNTLACITIPACIYLLEHL